MSWNGILIFLVLVNFVCARPDPQGPDYQYSDYPESGINPCEPDWTLNGGLEAPPFNVDIQTQYRYFNYSCIPEKRCPDFETKRSAQGAFSIKNLISEANRATCDEGEKCCPGNLVLNSPPEKRCSDQPGYKCVLSRRCNDDPKEDENMMASCDDQTSNGPAKICCKDIEPDEENPTDECSKIDGYRCVSKDMCSTNQITPRSLPFAFAKNAAVLLELQASEADCGETQECCADVNIKRPCEDYAADGYKCVNIDSCLDMEQDKLAKSERKSNIEDKFYSPRTTTCKENEQKCCRRTEITVVCADGTKVTGQDPKCPPSPPKKCEDWGEGYACRSFNDCDPDSLALINSTDKQSATQKANPNLLGALFSDTADKFISPLGDDSLGLNSDLTPCKVIFGSLSCCKEKQKKVCDPAVDCSGQGSCQPDGSCKCNEGFDGEDCSSKPRDCNWPQIKCGDHNINGVERTIAMPKQTSEQGEWPHACLVFENGKIIGGASLITPKVLVTAGHLLQRPDRTRLVASDLKIRCGEYNLASGTYERFRHQDRDVDTYTIHPYFSGSNESDPFALRNNIAVVHTTKEFKQAPNVNTICLPRPQRGFSENVCQSMGWGVKENTITKERSRSNIMKQVLLNRVIDQDLCQKQIKDTERISKTWLIDESQLCAARINADNSTSLCKGDGGGPLICQEQGTQRNVLAGVVSWSIGCGLDTVPDVFSSVEDALCFISADIKCKHGRKYLEHNVHPPECNNWLTKRIAEEEESNKSPRYKRSFGRFLRRLKAISNSCKRPNLAGFAKRSFLDIANAQCDE